MSITTDNKFMTLPLWIYVVVLLFFVYLFTQILGFRAEITNNIFLQGMYLIELGIHEMSHIIVMFLPFILVALAGSVGEIAFTFLVLLATIKGKSYFASVFAGLWIMLAFNSVGRYIADARSQSLPLIGPGASIQHDWNYILGQLGLLNSDLFIGGTIRVIGDIIGVLALAFGLWLIYQKINKKITTHSLPSL